MDNLEPQKNNVSGGALMLIGLMFLFITRFFFWNQGILYICGVAIILLGFYLRSREVLPSRAQNEGNITDKKNKNSFKIVYLFFFILTFLPIAFFIFMFLIAPQIGL